MVADHHAHFSCYRGNVSITTLRGVIAHLIHNVPFRHLLIRRIPRMAMRTDPEGAGSQPAPYLMPGRDTPDGARVGMLPRIPASMTWMLGACHTR